MERQFERCRRLAKSLIELGEDAKAVEAQLLRWDFDPALARESTAWATADKGEPDVFHIGDVVQTPIGCPWIVVSNAEDECPFRYEVRSLSGRSEMFEGQQMTLIERPRTLMSMYELALPVPD